MDAPRPAVPESRRVAVAAPHHLAVDAAREVVEAGGGVVDAALAAAMALAVVYPHQSSLGGDLFAVVRRPDGSMTSVDASGRHGSGGLPPEGRVPVSGPFSVTVPGVASGWAALHDLGGTIPASRLLEPAVRLAADGIEVTDRLAAAIASADLDTDDDPGMRSFVTDEAGDRLRAGAVLRQQALAGSLRTLAADGLLGFYDGGLGDAVAAGLARLGVPVSREDLRRHRATTGEPLTVEVAGCRLSTSPPGSQGYLLLSTMLAADLLEARGVELDHRVLLELFTLTGARRDAELADPDHLARPVADLLDLQQVERDVATVLRRVGGSSPPVTEAPSPRGGDTVSVTAVGTDWTAVSVIQSLYFYFGSRLHDPVTGITFHNRAAGFSSRPGSPNAVAPGKRPAHTLMPLVVEHPDGRIAAHGAMGGRAQPQIHTQVLRQRLAGATAQEAVTAPRFVVAVLDRAGTYGVHAEPGLGEAALDRLASGDLPFQRGTHLDEEVGHAMVCAVGPDGTLEAGADPRSDGTTWAGGPIG
jgi:gamma-glutamyltranspeptidase